MLKQPVVRTVVAISLGAIAGALCRYYLGLGIGHILGTVVPYGTVETLFVPVGEQVWGIFDPTANAVQIHAQPRAGDEDLLDLAALHTLTNGGTVYAVEPGSVPEDQSIAAIFRY